MSGELKRPRGRASRWDCGGIGRANLHVPFGGAAEIGSGRRCGPGSGHCGSNRSKRGGCWRSTQCPPRHRLCWKFRRTSVVAPTTDYAQGAAEGQATVADHRGAAPPASPAVESAALAEAAVLVPRQTHTLRAGDPPARYEYQLGRPPTSRSICSTTAPDNPEAQNSMAHVSGAFPGLDLDNGGLDRPGLAPGTYYQDVFPPETGTLTYTITITARPPGLAIERRDAVGWPGSEYGRWVANSAGAMQFSPTGQLGLLVAQGNRYIYAQSQPGGRLDRRNGRLAVRRLRRRQRAAVRSRRRGQLLCRRRLPVGADTVTERPVGWCRSRSRSRPSIWPSTCTRGRTAQGGFHLILNDYYGSRQGGQWVWVPLPVDYFNGAAAWCA